MSDSIRKLVTLQPVAAVREHPNADRLDIATVLGWNVVVGRGEVQPGDTVLYFEIDAALPLHNPLFGFLAPRGSKTIDGLQYHVLRTAKLRGEYSQGLVIRPDEYLLTDIGAYMGFGLNDDWDQDVFGRDLSAFFGVVKYEPPIPAELSGAVAGPFPTDLVKKTDAERVENLVADYDELRATGDWRATEKVDGTSVTLIATGDPENPLRICSRNWELVPNPDLTQVKAALAAGIDKLPAGTIVQAELYGEGIQSNRLGVKGQHLAVFGVFSAAHTPVPADQWPESLTALRAPALDLGLPATVAEAVAQADGLKSQIAPGRLAEGIVWHEKSGKTFDVLDGRSCFKAISRKYLSKEK